MATGEYQARPHDELIRELLDSRIPKSEREHAAAREIERLRKEPHPAITHCDNCGCDWLDNGLNPIGCPYCELSAETEASIDAVQPEASTTLEQAESHAHICAKLAEEHKDDTGLSAALTDAAAIIRDLMRELRREAERR